MRLLCIGDNVVDRYLDLGVMYPGGNCVNVAVFASRLGAEVAYAGVLGDDPAGRLVLASLRAEGVDVSHTRVEHGTNAYALVRLVDGDRRFQGSDKGVSLFDLDAAEIELAQGYDVVHTAYSARWLDQLPKLIGAGCRVAYDAGHDFSPASIAGLPGLWLAAFSGSHLDDAEAERTARASLAAGSRHVLITQGPRGARLWSPEGSWFHPAADIPVLDTLGAGDAHLASVILSLTGTDDPAEAMAKGSALAAEVITVQGAFGHGAPDPGVPATQGVNRWA